MAERHQHVGHRVFDIRLTAADSVFIISCDIDGNVIQPFTSTELSGPARVLRGARGVGFDWFTLSVLAVVLMGAVCSEGPIITAWVINRTGQAIDINLVVDGDEELLVSLDKPVSASHSQEVFEGPRFYPDNCTTGPLVARNRQGEEIARLEESLCAFQTWMIEADGTSYTRP